MKNSDRNSNDVARLERKINLLNDKLDRLMEGQGIELKKSEEEIDKEEEKKRKVRERQQVKILREQNIKAHVNRIMDDWRLKHQAGYELQKKFDLVTVPSAARIKEYQRTGDCNAFKGLKRNK